MTSEGVDSDAELFETESSAAVDFEITLAALLATAVLSSFGIANLTLFLRPLAFSLLLVTLIRRMALISDFADDIRIMYISAPFVEIFSVISLIQILVVTSDWLAAEIAYNVGVLRLFMGLAIIVVVVAALFQEFVFYDWLEWWAYKFSKRSTGDDIWKFTATHAQEFSFAPPPTKNERRRQWRKYGVVIPEGRNEGINLSISWVQAILAEGKWILFPLIVGYLLFDSWLTSFIIVAITSLLDDHLKFLYLSYGNTEIDNPIRNNILNRALFEMRRPWFTVSLFILFVSQIIQ